MSTAPTYKPLEIEVTDFGPIAKAKLDLRPLTVFVGPSNTGKSYLATLIYALHRFFGGDAHSPGFNTRDGHSLFDRFVEAWGDEQEISEEDTKALLAWMNRLFECTQGEALPEDFRARVPDDVAPLLHPFLRKVSTLGDFLNDEIARCFGSEGTARLIRSGSTEGARVVMTRDVSEASQLVEPIGYTFTVRGDETALRACIPESMPLKIGRNDADSSHQQEIMQWISRTNATREHQRFADAYEKHASQQADPQQRAYGMDVVEEMQRRIHTFAQSRRNELVGVVGSSIISPLNRAAHYLPASRTGLMHARWVVVDSLIQRSARAFYQREESLPSLSGVLADFLQQLVAFGDSSRGKRNGYWILDRTIEKEILGGTVHEKQSPTGLPIFSYQPAGRKEKIPLLQASSMVSELAPVVLYLRHVVQPRRRADHRGTGVTPSSRNAGGVYAAACCGRAQRCTCHVDHA